MAIKSPVSVRERRLLGSTLTLVVLSLCYIFVIEPFYKKYIALDQEIQVKQVRLMKNRRLMREKDAITKQFEKHRQLLTTKGSQEEEMALVLSEIEKTGKEANIYLSDVKPQRVRDMEFYRELLVEIKYQASIQTLTKFIYNLQNSPSLLKVKRLQINIKGGESTQIEGTLQISKIALS